jgi:hypothetical protein
MRPDDPRQSRAFPDTRGLTGSHRPLYSGGFATSACRLGAKSPCGGIGRRARLKIEFRKECWFDSGQGHQLSTLCSALTFLISAAIAHFFFRGEHI